MNRTDGEDLAAVDQALRELPKIDPPPALVRRTLDGVTASQARAKRSRHLGAMALALAVVVLTVGVALLLPRSSDLAEGQLALGPATPPASTATEGRYAGSEGQTGDKITGALEQAPPTEPEVVRGWRQPAEERNQPLDGNVPAADDDGHDEGAARLPYAAGVDIPSQELDGFDWRGPAGGEGRDGNNVKVPDDWADKSVSGLLDAEAKEGETGEVLLDGKRSITLDAQTIVAQPGYFATEITVGDLGKAGKIDLVTRLPAGGQVTQDDRAQGEDGDDEQMRQALARLSSTDEEVAGRTSAIPPDLRFIPARGWFANTYIPGDGDVARLDLGRVTRKLGGLPTGTQPALEAVRGVAQPFDRPVGQALSLQLAADRTAVEGPTRLTLQIGLAGAAPVKARRAPIATALVIDVASASDEVERQTLWSLADALVAERQPGDAFTIVVPRAAGPTLLGGEALSAGELARTLAAAAEERQALEPGVIEAAYRAVGEARAAAAAPSNKRGATLGATTVVVATAGPLAPELMTALGQRAHAEALGDVQLAVVGAGARIDRQALATLAQRGQGRRWLASSPADARRVIGEELGSAGRTVARAVRVGIRLAPGVRLVEVVGSHPLAVVDREQARAAEAAIDKRLSDVTGIAMDRGADDEGIQIMIPAFMAGDDHAILLDVVVPGPGPVLDVRLRWKDLLRMDNAEAQASLTLPSGKDQATPLALNVVENRAAMVASEALLAAARDVARHQPAAAAPVLSNARRELDALARRAPTVRQQTRVVDHYEALIREAPAWIEDDAARDEMVRALESTGRTLR